MLFKILASFKVFFSMILGGYLLDIMIKKLKKNKNVSHFTPCNTPTLGRRPMFTIHRSWCTGGGWSTLANHGDQHMLGPQLYNATYEQYMIIEIT